MAIVPLVATGHWALVVAVLGLALLIFVHELGHFLAAKAFHMRVERFYIGFPPAVVKRTWGETEYGVGMIPLGGFCKISGMTPDEKLPDDVAPRAYINKPVWQRNITIFAGPFMNFVAAVAIMFVFIQAGGIQQPTLTVAQVVKGSPGRRRRPASRRSSHRRPTAGPSRPGTPRRRSSSRMRRTRR